jgi:hypothetical protein
MADKIQTLNKGIGKKHRDTVRMGDDTYGVEPTGPLLDPDMTADRCHIFLIQWKISHVIE